MNYNLILRQIKIQRGIVVERILGNILDGFININTEQDLRVRQIHVYKEGYSPIYHEFMRSHRENLFSATKVYSKR